tara:strand:+ start:354 stop:536 length:183 start_codon:yes stop_codon:yes gene_type:complete
MIKLISATASDFQKGFIPFFLYSINDKTKLIGKVKSDREISITRTTIPHSNPPLHGKIDR